MSNNPLQQFEIKTIIPIKIGNLDISFTNATLWMMCVAIVLILFGHLASKKLTLIPSASQLFFEKVYSFISELLKSNVGNEGVKFVPYVLPLFLFILGANLLGMLPYSYTVTSQLAVTISLALAVFLMATIVGIIKHKKHFFRLFFPAGAPLYVAPILIPIEIISYCSRPISLGARLFANMVAGHVMIKIFAGFVSLLLKSPLAILSILPIFLNVVLTGFEIMVAVLQAYVFTILTCIYLNDALNLH